MSKTITIISIIFIAISLSACNNSKQEATKNESMLVSADSLVNIWNNAWNSKDIQAIGNTLSDNVVYLEGKLKISGKDSIMEKFVKTNIQRIANLKTEKVSANATSEMAFYSGFYSLDQKRNDSIIGQVKGVFTFVWVKTADNSWKIISMQMADY